MKKLILTAVALAAFTALSLTAQAQGRIVFGNLGVTTQRIIDQRTGLNLVAPAGTYEYGLYIGAAGSTAAQLTLVGVTFNLPSTTTASPAGAFNGGSPYIIPTTAGVTLDGSASIVFQIRGWSANLGSSYEAASVSANIDANSLFGISALGSVTPTLSPTAAPNIFGTGVGQIQGFVMKPVPEPTTLALAGLGAASLLLFRRRK